VTSLQPKLSAALILHYDQLAIAETTLQGGLVMAKKWKTGTGRQYFTDIIGLSTTTVTQLASKAIKFGEKMQNKGYYTIQGHSRSSRSLIESPYAISY